MLVQLKLNPEILQTECSLHCLACALSDHQRAPFILGSKNRPSNLSLAIYKQLGGIEPRIDPVELWRWRRLLRVPWTARRSNQSILKEISPEYSLEGLNDFEADTLAT